MRNREIIERINETIEQLKDLAGKISDEGQPLSKRERELLKVSFLAYFRDIQDEQRHFFLTDSVKDFDRSVDSLRNLFINS